MDNFDDRAAIPAVQSSGEEAGGRGGERPRRLICPACGGHDLSRIRRRLIDRVLCLFVKRRRYRCRGFQCAWEGNLRVD